MKRGSTGFEEPEVRTCSCVFDLGMRNNGYERFFPSVLIGSVSLSISHHSMSVTDESSPSPPHMTAFPPPPPPTTSTQYKHRPSFLPSPLFPPNPLREIYLFFSAGFPRGRASRNKTQDAIPRNVCIRVSYSLRLSRLPSVC